MGQRSHKQEKGGLLEFSHKNNLCFQILLNHLASEYPEHLNIVHLDNRRFHYR